MRRHVLWMVSASIVVLVTLSTVPALAQTGSCQLAPVFVLPWKLSMSTCREGSMTTDKTREEILEEAVRFYANEKLYEVSCPLVGGAWGSAPRDILNDCGQAARIALARAEEAK